MEKLIFLLALSAALSLPRAAEGQTTFQKTFGGGTAYAVEKTNDGNLIITGDPMFLLKMDPNGNVLWHKSYSSGSDVMTGSSVVQTTDGGFIITGTLNIGTPTSEVVLLKTDASGNPLWSKTYGGFKDESGSQVKQTLDGGFVIIGSTKSFGTNFDDIYLIKTDSNGNLQWSRVIADSPVDVVDYGNSIIQSLDSGYVITGRIDNPFGNDNDLGLIKLTKNGFASWVKSYGGTGDDGGNFIISTSDGGYAVAGYTESFGAGASDAYLIKTDSNGNLIWSKTYGGISYDKGRDIEEMPDGGYFLSGRVILSGKWWLCGIKADTSGDTLWTNFYGGSGAEDGFSATKLQSGYILAGLSNSFSSNDEIYVIKTDSLGYSGCYESNQTITVTTPATIVTTPSIQVSTPLTVVNNISISASNVSSENTLCSLVSVVELNTNEFIASDARLVGIYDLLGRPVLRSLGEGGEVPVGIYIYQYIDKKGQSFFKKEMIVR